MLVSRRGQQFRTRARKIRYSEDEKIAFRKFELPWAGMRNIDLELLEQSENTASLRGPWLVMVPSHHDDWNPAQLATHPGEIRKRVHDGRIHRPHRVKNVAADHHQVGSKSYNEVYGALEAAFDVRLALIETALSEAMVLSKADVKIGEMDESHVPNLSEGS